jgi:hypothetical protein
LLPPSLHWYGGSEHLSSVYLAADRPALTLVFDVTLRGAPTPSENLHFAAPGDAMEVYDAQAQTQANNARDLLSTVPFYVAAAD